MTYTPADPYTVFFPGSTTQKPDNIVDGQDILYQHVSPLWDEVIKTQDVLRGIAGSALTIAATGASSIPLTVIGVTTQTADILRVRSATGPSGPVDLLKVGPDGKTTGYGRIALTSPTGPSSEVIGNYLALSDAQPAFKIGNDGTFGWGAGGSNLTDTNLYRNSSGVLRTNNTMLVGGNVIPSAFSGTGINLNPTGVVDIAQSSAGAVNALTISGNGDSQYRFRIFSNGSLGWSAGSGIIDATLARSSSNTLTLTGSLVISSALTVGGKTPVYTDNAALTDSRAPTGPASGDLTGNYPAPTIKADVALSGTPSAATAAIDTSSTQLATTAFVINQASNSAPLSTSTSSAIGTSARYARADHVHTIGNDSVILGTHTTGNYVATLASSGSITVSGSGSESAAVTVNLPNVGTAGTYTSVTTDQWGRVTAGGYPTYIVGVTGTARTVVTTGPSGPTGSVIATVDLAPTGTAGTYTSVTTDTYGRVTAGGNPTYVAGITGPVGVTTPRITIATGPSGPTGSVITTIDLAPTGTAGTYTSVTTDSYGRVTSGSVPLSVSSVTGPTGPIAFSVSGPTGSNAVTVSIPSQSANTVLAGPTTGSAATSSFRTLVAADIPTIAASQVSGTAVTQADTGTISYGMLGASVTNYQTTGGAYNVNVQSGSTYTFALADAQNKIVEYSGIAVAVFTVPSDATTNFPLGCQITILQTGSGSGILSIAGASSPNAVTINATPGLKLRTQWSSATLIKRAANTWVLIGDLMA